nr:MAG TPA: hypothetical protein [Caudoviricetes sp.]
MSPITEPLAMGYPIASGSYLLLEKKNRKMYFICLGELAPRQ